MIIKGKNSFGGEDKSFFAKKIFSSTGPGPGEKLFINNEFLNTILS